MRNVVLHGDCLELMNEIPAGSVDMILCDLPYGTTACKWDTIIPFEPLWVHYKRIIKDNGAIVLTASQPFTSKLVMSNLEIFKYELIWDKVQGKQPFLAKIQPMKSHENICVFGINALKYNPQMLTGIPYKDKRGGQIAKSDHYGKFIRQSYDNIGERYPLSVCTFNNPNQKDQHPTQKPVALFEYLIRTYTDKGDLVLDNCAGSGTTGVACINADRDYILIEQEQKYIDIIKQRLFEASSQGKFDF